MRVFFRGSDLYLLGRTLTTYILRRYHFSSEMLLEGTGGILDLGELLAEYESPPLPDPSIPWGSFDREEAFLDPSSHASVLAVREWFSAGFYIRFLFNESTPNAPTLVTLEAEKHLPDNANFHPRWLGRDQALMFSQDDDFVYPRRLVRLSFARSDHGEASSPGCATAMSSSVVREDLSWLSSLEECGLGASAYPDLLAVDEESGRICFMLLEGDGVILSRSTE